MIPLAVVLTLGWALGQGPGERVRPREVRSVLTELGRLDRELTAAEEKLVTLEQQEHELRKELARIETELAATRIRQEQAFERYAARLRALARMPAGARLVLLGGTRSLSDFLQANRVLRWVASHDRVLQQSYHKETADLQELEAALAKRQEHQRTLIAEVRAKRDEAAARRRERVAFLEQVATYSDLAHLAVRERNQAGQQLAGMMERLESKAEPTRSFSASRGLLPWPTAGRLDVRFGQRVEQDFGTVTSHSGWDLRAPPGTEVQAIAAGKVVYADWLKGYGQLVIVDHGEHYHSLVAHLGTLAVAVGDVVTQGQQLGTVGDTGSLRGTVLYFELRERGRPVDPADWLQ